jgi:hypothetical protein
MTDPDGSAPERGSVGLPFVLIVVPRFILRWRIATAVTSLFLGASAGFRRMGTEVQR